MTTRVFNETRFASGFCEAFDIHAITKSKNYTARFAINKVSRIQSWIYEVQIPQILDENNNTCQTLITHTKSFFV